MALTIDEQGQARTAEEGGGGQQVIKDLTGNWGIGATSSWTA